MKGNQFFSRSVQKVITWVLTGTLVFSFLPVSAIASDASDQSSQSASFAPSDGDVNLGEGTSGDDFVVDTPLNTDSDSSADQAEGLSSDDADADQKGNTEDSGGGH